MNTTVRYTYYVLYWLLHKKYEDFISKHIFANHPLQEKHVLTGFHGRFHTLGCKVFPI